MSQKYLVRSTITREFIESVVNPGPLLQDLLQRLEINVGGIPDDATFDLYLSWHPPGMWLFLADAAIKAYEAQSDDSPSTYGWGRFGYMNHDDPVVRFLDEKFDGVHRHLDEIRHHVHGLEQRMSDFSSQVESDTTALAADFEQISSKLDAAEANQLSQADVDALHAVRTKADTLLAGAASTTGTTPNADTSTGDASAPNPTDASSAGAPSTGDQTATSGSDTVAPTDSTSADTTTVTTPPTPQS